MLYDVSSSDEHGPLVPPDGDHGGHLLLSGAARPSVGVLRREHELGRDALSTHPHLGAPQGGQGTRQVALVDVLVDVDAG